MLVHLKFVPYIFLQSFLVTLLETSYKTNFANSVCNFPLTKLSQISKVCQSAKWCFLDHFYENQNDKYNKGFLALVLGGRAFQTVDRIVEWKLNGNLSCMYRSFKDNSARRSGICGIPSSFL